MWRYPIPKEWKKVLVSIIILFHLLVVLVVPNSMSFLYKWLSPVVPNYANFLGINNAWQLFSPDPTPTIYLDYRIFKDEEVIKEGFLPGDKSKVPIRSYYTRRATLMRYLMTDMTYVGRLLVPWICRENRGATEVEVTKRTVIAPTLQEVNFGRKITDESISQNQMLTIESCPNQEFNE